MLVVIPTSSILKLALAGGFLAFRSGDRGPMGKEQKAGIALLAGAAGFAVAPTFYQLAHGLRGSVKVPPAKEVKEVPAKAISLRPARPKGTRTRPGAKPTKTWGPEAGAKGKPRNAVFAIAMCVLVAGGRAAMVLGQGSSTSSAASEDGEEPDDVQDVPAAGEDAANGSGGDSSAPGDVDDVQDVPAADEDAANGSGGDSSAPGDAPDDPSGVGDKSDTVLDDAHACNEDVGGSPPPPPPPSETTSASDEDNKGSSVYGLDWSALVIALAVIAAFKKYKALRGMSVDIEDIVQDNLRPAQVALEAQEHSSAYLRDGANAGLAATAACAASASTKQSAISSQFVDLATIVDDKEKQLALICNSAFPGEAAICNGDCAPTVNLLDEDEASWEWDYYQEKQPPVSLNFIHSPEEALNHIIASGSGSPVQEDSAKGYRYGDQMITFMKRSLLSVLAGIIAYLFLTIDRLNAAIEDIDQEDRQQAATMEPGSCESKKESIYGTPFESTGTDAENDTPADFASNTAIVEQDVADAEPTVEEPEQTILTDVVAEVTMMKRSLSSPAVFTSPIKEVAVAESISSSKTFPDHMPDIAPAPAMAEDPISASTSTASPDIEIVPPTPTIQQTHEVFSIPVVGGERPRRRVRGGRRGHTRAARGHRNGQEGGSSTLV